MRLTFPILPLLATCALAACPAFADDKKALSDEDFVRMAASGGMLEVKSSQFALEQATSDEVKKFARHMIDDHTKANQELMAVAGKKGIAVPAGLEKKHADVVAKLGMARAGTFDAQYASAQVDSHEEAVSLFERQAKDGKDSDLKAFAEKTLPKLKEHLKMARDLNKSVGKGDKGDKDREER